ncbi:MAG: hemin uptake protein HemP [Pseudomonadales bacterium]|nr:hemin uptake protein HemP [Pseudomonadales bacterium]MCP5358467.1 hemin uptake protein HemP [Pseudomonadales bacterium]
MSDSTQNNAERRNTCPEEISSARLLGPKGTLVILHNGERYTLRITANRKLILTK